MPYHSTPCQKVFQGISNTIQIFGGDDEEDHHQFVISLNHQSTLFFPFLCFVLTLPQEPRTT
jgi:hypothetical protein